MGEGVLVCCEMMKGNFRERGSGVLTQLIQYIPFGPSLETPVEEVSVNLLSRPKSHEEWKMGDVNKPAVQGENYYAPGTQDPPVDL